MSWYDAIRFSNWLHNGQGSSDTETGAYTLLGGTPIPSNANSISRNPNAKWFLPNENEWYKAAYYDPNTVTYYEFPTSSDTPPNNNLPSTDTGNSANYVDMNFGYTTGNRDYPMTDVGEYTLSASPYGTFDQGGNVLEWNEALVSSYERGFRGGFWEGLDIDLAANSRDGFNPIGANEYIGFRVASIAIPEPTTLLLASLTGVLICSRTRRL